MSGGIINALIASTGLGALCFIGSVVVLIGKPGHDLGDNGAELDSFEAAFGDLIAVPLGFGSTKPAANCWERGESPGAATGFAKHQLEGPSNKPLGSAL